MCRRTSLNGLRARNCSKSTWRFSRSRKGLRSSGFSCDGEKCPAQLASALLAGDKLMASPLPCVMISQGICLATPVQKSARPWRAPSRPPFIQPSANTTAFMAPALLPLRPSNSMPVSSSSASSTPQVKAPCEPPPCRARLSRLGMAPLRRLTRLSADRSGNPGRLKTAGLSIMDRPSEQTQCHAWHLQITSIGFSLKQQSSVSWLGNANVAFADCDRIDLPARSP